MKLILLLDENANFVEYAEWSRVIRPRFARYPAIVVVPQTAKIDPLKNNGYHGERNAMEVGRMLRSGTIFEPTGALLVPAGRHTTGKTPLHELKKEGRQDRGHTHQP